MILDADIRSQLSQYLQLMEGPVLLKVSTASDSISNDMVALANELASMSPFIKVEKVQLERTPSFSVNKPDYDPGITFAHTIRP